MARAKKDKDLIEEIETKVDEVEAKMDVKSKKKTKRQLELEIRKNKNDIELEILNISTGRCSYANGYGKYYFNLESGQSKTLTLDEIQEVCFDAKSFFTDYELVIVDVYSEEYTLDNILDYLSLSEIYEDIKDHDDDYMEDILLNYSDEDFNSLIGIKDVNFSKSLASKAIYLHNKKKDISREKEYILKKVLNLETLFHERE